MGKLFVEQKLHLWDPLDKYLPEDLGLRQADGTPIELVHLATHTSGMPEMPSNFDDLHPEDYSQEDLYEYLESYQPENVGESYSYSNVAFGALGDALAICQGDGRGLEQIIREDIIEALDLAMFYEPFNTDQEERMAQGYRCIKTTLEVVLLAKKSLDFYLQAWFYWRRGQSGKSSSATPRFSGCHGRSCWAERQHP